jgi:hypothetical protein
MSVLIYENRKQDPDFYDMSTPAKEAAAWLRLFNYLREEWQVYGDLESEPEALVVCEACAKDLCRLCESGTCACDKTDECKKRLRVTKRQLDSTNRMKTLYASAMKGDSEAAKKLLHLRKSYEYENFQIGSLIDPTEEED